MPGNRNTFDFDTDFGDVLESLEALPDVEDFDQEPPGKKTAGEATGLKTGTLRLCRRGRHVVADLSKVKRAADQIGELPGRDVSLHCLMGGDYNGFDIVPAIVRLAKGPIRNLYITTLGFNQANNVQLCAMIDAGEIARATVLCSDYFKNANKDTYLDASKELKARGQRLSSARNHSKIILAEAGRGFYVVESSANLRSCNNLEQFCLTHSRALYEFHRGWIEEVVSRDD